jgi:peptidoglycan/xylan/chitin deacetylase (PgdA/CDA1 family)
MRRRDFLRSMGVLGGAGLLPGSIPLSNLSSWLSARADRADNTPFDVYMTFDDGPFPNPDLKTGPTDVVLQTLKDNEASATFFLHGRHILPWHGPVLVRYLTEGHAIGNHLWSQGGNTTVDKPTYTRLAYQYLLTEAKIREMLQKTDLAVYNQYMQQGKLFRRPGGTDHLNEFLDPTNYNRVKFDPLLRPLEDEVEWLKSVFDYSGWHINGGESIPFSIRPQTPDQERDFILHGRNGYYGINEYLQAGNPPQHSVEANQGLIILMHDEDNDTDVMLPQLIHDLRDLGAHFRSLPRPIDMPNTHTVGISHPPTATQQSK